MNHTKSQLNKLLMNIESFRWNVALKSLLVGLLAGMLAAFYRFVTEKGTDFAVSLYSYIKLHPSAIIIWIVLALLAGLFIAWLIKLEPMASGGGVPQVEGVILYGLKMKWHMVITVRYLAGILGSLFGLSFGPEGPSIQLGAAIGQEISSKMCKTKMEKNCLVTAGAAAGLSAAFSAPLTGIIFALEEIHRSFSPTILLAATTASLTSDFVSKFFFGLMPVLNFQNIPQLPLNLYIWLLPLGIFVGLVGIITNRGMLLFQVIYGKIPRRLRPVIALLICLPCGLLLPEVLGSGRNLIDIVEQNRYAFSMVVVLLLVKILFSCTSFGSGTPGGIFMPIISISALAGSVFGLIAVHLGVPSKFLPVFIICSLAGGLSSCVKAPVTSIVLTAELIGSFLHILPVAICSFVALFISDLFRTAPIYEALLNRYIEKHGYTIPFDDRPGELVEIPVEYDSEISGKLLRDIGWPKGSLIIGLRRGSEELIPKGETKIMPGDYLLIITPKSDKHAIKQEIRHLCQRFDKNAQHGPYGSSLG